ncbi:hypothetical protein [Erwinia sorbitola]|uniref:hypothetical protein n=1 Tax=Erwinia sorbitola TaxID=2681984 RepID=UPI001E635941|nr:hypothetical protein [Erwinia sorbitola]
MAYEGLFIYLMAIGFNPTDIDINLYVDMGGKLNLGKESILDADFWSNLMSYISKY